VDGLPVQGSVSLVMKCRPLLIYWIELCPGHHLIAVPFLNGDIMDCYFVLLLFPVPASHISLRRCHCICILSCGCVGLFVRR